MSQQTHYRFAAAWLPSGWHRNVVISVDSEGDIHDIVADDEVSAAHFIDGAAIPGMPNVHSHAFQRAMAGLTEHYRSVSGERSDSFWTWREAMYEHARGMSPDRLNAIAAQLYVDMLKAGYTAVCEFHYLHHPANGRPHDAPYEMCQALMDAAATSGIGLTLLPTLYQTSDFGEAAPTQRQKQFVLETERYLDLLSQLRSSARPSPQLDFGVAFHSLRAVPLAALRAVLETERGTNVIHMHIAEQKREVVASQHHSGRRPIEWLLENVSIDHRWCLVHGTHATAAELEQLALARVVIALCPTTEANLGDGLFRVDSWLGTGGAFAIGSDSHICVSPAEELRWLEYQVRLIRRRRNVLAQGRNSSSGAFLWRQACEAGAHASGRNIGALAVGRRADIVVLDLNEPLFTERAGDDIIDTFVFASSGNAVRDVMVGGRWLVQDGRHFAEAAVASGYRRALQNM